MKKAIIITKGNFEKCRALAELEDYTPIQEFNNFDDGFKFSIDNDIKVIFINSLSDLGNDANEAVRKFSLLNDECIDLYSYAEKLDTTSAVGKYIKTFLFSLNEIGR